MNKKIKVCIVGLGRAGNIHLNSIKNLESFELRYVVDVDPDAPNKISATYDYESLTDIHKALEDDTLDAVIISSPTDSHFKYIQQSLEAGKHVFTEKPLGHSLEDVKVCFELAELQQRALYLGFQRRYDKNFMALKESLPRLGSCRIVKTSSRDNPRPSIDYLNISGNIFHDMLIHDFDMLLYLFGMKIPESIYAVGHAYDQEIADIPDFDTVMVTINYPDGMMCSIDTSRTSPYGYDQRIEVFGEHGMACVENQRNNTVKWFDANGLSQEPFHHSFPQRYKEAYVTELESFANGIRAGIPHNVAKEACMLGHLMADAALESATTGVAIDFKSAYAGQFSG